MEYEIKSNKTMRKKTRQISRQKKIKKRSKSINRSKQAIPWSSLSSSSVPSLAAARLFRKRIAFKHTFIFTTAHSLLSVPHLAATRPLVRSRTSKFTWESIRTSARIRVLKVAGRAFGPKAIWETMSVATLEKSKCNWASILFDYHGNLIALKNEIYWLIYDGSQRC